jgi:hypothetical protein
MVPKQLPISHLSDIQIPFVDFRRLIALHFDEQE